MTKPKTVDECGIGPFWKVRVCLHGAILHLASRTEPVLRMSDGRPAAVELDPIVDTEHGDTIGFIDWPVVTAVTWRKAGGTDA
jgi:hypothetical protein